jgi:hypothetical protein
LIEEEGFNKWLVNKTNNTAASEMVDDLDFCCRLLDDVFSDRTRKRHNNRSRDKRGFSSMDVLKREYQEFKDKEGG